MSTDRSERRAGTVPGSVALFIDWDNFAIGLRQEMPERPADVGPILRWARRLGVLTVCRAYGEWRDPQERLAIYNAGVEVVYAPVLPLGGSVVARSGLGGAKSLADTAMAVDVTEALSLMPSITSVILATSDKDLIPVLRFAQRRGLHAVVVGSDRTAGALRDLADEFISYRQLLEQEVPSGTQTRPAAVPPVRYPRAPRAVGALPAPAEPMRRGRFEARPPRSVITPAPAAAALTEAAPLGESTSPGSVFADGESGPPGETPAEAAARRRRRGGRRRRGREVTGAGAAEAATELAEDVAEATEEEGPAPEEVAETVQVAPGELAAEGPVAVQEAAAPPGAPARPAPTAPAAGRGPVVLPGERLRRLAGATPEPPAAATAPAAEPEAAPEPGPEEAEGDEAEEGAEEAEGGPGARTARARRRGGRGRATKTATKSATKGAATKTATKTATGTAKTAQPRRATKRA